MTLQNKIYLALITSVVLFLGLFAFYRGKYKQCQNDNKRFTAEQQLNKKVFDTVLKDKYLLIDSLQKAQTKLFNDLTITRIETKRLRNDVAASRTRRYSAPTPSTEKIVEFLIDFADEEAKLNK